MRSWTSVGAIGVAACLATVSFAQSSPSPAAEASAVWNAVLNRSFVLGQDGFALSGLDDGPIKFMRSPGDGSVEAIDGWFDVQWMDGAETSIPLESLAASSPDLTAIRERVLVGTIVGPSGSRTDVRVSVVTLELASLGTYYVGTILPPRSQGILTLQVAAPNNCEGGCHSDYARDKAAAQVVRDIGIEECAAQAQLELAGAAVACTGLGAAAIACPPCVPLAFLACMTPLTAFIVERQIACNNGKEATFQQTLTTLDGVRAGCIARCRANNGNQGPQGPVVQATIENELENRLIFDGRD